MSCSRDAEAIVKCIPPSPLPTCCAVASLFCCALSPAPCCAVSCPVLCRAALSTQAGVADSPADSSSSSSSRAATAAVLAEPVAANQELITGQLDNGLRYVLLPNPSPPQRFEAHLEVHAGSVDEREHEQVSGCTLHTSCLDGFFGGRGGGGVRAVGRLGLQVGAGSVGKWDHEQAMGLLFGWRVFKEMGRGLHDCVGARGGLKDTCKPHTPLKHPFPYEGEGGVTVGCSRHLPMWGILRPACKGGWVCRRRCCCTWTVLCSSVHGWSMWHKCAGYSLLPQSHPVPIGPPRSLCTWTGLAAFVMVGWRGTSVLGVLGGTWQTTR
jgi:hypothetical protein